MVFFKKKLSKESKFEKSFGDFRENIWKLDVFKKKFST